MGAALQREVEFWRGRHGRLLEALGKGEVAEHLEVVAVHLNATLQGARLAPVAVLRRSVALHTRDAPLPLATAAPRRLRKAQKGPRLAAATHSKAPTTTLPAVPQFPAFGAEAQAGSPPDAAIPSAGAGAASVEHNDEHDGEQDVVQHNEDVLNVDGTGQPDLASDVEEYKENDGVDGTAGCAEDCQQRLDAVREYLTAIMEGDFANGQGMILTCIARLKSMLREAQTILGDVDNGFIAEEAGLERHEIQEVISFVRRQYVLAEGGGISSMRCG
ncbi:unnamed protein product [Prorocentrum cordatum]|uniref:Uncharacterized protein n=1 Tax=Prorocentrum cordatum TaxID=2364126 RepID=A0ABN9QJB9_9DINO|nr:unnamed protein product [Polarella glacialis]